MIIFATKFRKSRRLLREIAFRIISLFRSAFGPDLADVSVTRQVVPHDTSGDTLIVRVGTAGLPLFMMPVGDEREWLIYQTASLRNPKWLWLRSHLPSARFHVFDEHLVMTVDDGDHTRLLMLAV